MVQLYQQIIFYIFAALAAVSAVLVITQNNAVRCVLALVVTFFASAVLWMLQEAEFLSLILVLVYVGAVMTLFLFVVMMIDVDLEPAKTNVLKMLPIGLIMTAFFVALLLKALPSAIKQGAMTAATAVGFDNTSNTLAIGKVLYTDYLLVFEMAAVILLVAIICAITLIHRAVIRDKRQDVVAQIMTKKHDRLRIVKMPSEKN
jgi:NADH-quinone oxidoreductase subunit J